MCLIGIILLTDFYFVSEGIGFFQCHCKFERNAVIARHDHNMLRRFIVFKETNAFIFDKGTTDELSTMFERDKQNSHPLDREYWQKRSKWKKFVGWLGNLLTPFL